MPTTVPSLRGVHTVVIKAQANQPITIHLTGVQLGHYTSAARMVLYDPGMVKLADEIAAIHQTTEYTFTPQYSGPYVLALGAGTMVANAYHINVTGAPWIVAGEKLHCNSHAGRFYFWVDSAQTHVQLNIDGFGGETVSCRLYDPLGNIQVERETISNNETHIVEVDGLGGVWCLEAFDLVDDARFGVAGVDRYAISPDCVMHD